MKTDFTPEYGEKDADYRLVYKCNGHWAVQHLKYPDLRSNVRDKWIDLIGASRLSYEAARQRLALTQAQ